MYILSESIAVENRLKKANGRLLKDRHKVNFFVVLKFLIIIGDFVSSLFSHLLLMPAIAF